MCSSLISHDCRGLAWLVNIMDCLTQWKYYYELQLEIIQYNNTYRIIIGKLAFLLIVTSRRYHLRDTLRYLNACRRQ